MKRKSLALLLAAVLTLGITGCGSEKAEVASAPTEQAPAEEGVDRKSTRLNSSHIH